MNCFVKKKIASVYGLIFSSFDDQSPTFFRQNEVQMQSNRRNKAIAISNRSHHPAVSLSLSLSHQPKHTSTIGMVVVFFSYSTQRQFYNVYYFLSFSVLLPFSPHFIGHFLFNLSLSLALFSSHSLSHFFSSTLAHIIIMSFLLQ